MSLKNLTAADWRHINETIVAQKEGFDPEVGTEDPEEDIMTSIGYVRVGINTLGCCQDEPSGYVFAFGGQIDEDEFPRVVDGNEAIYLCEWSLGTCLDIAEDFIRSLGSRIRTDYLRYQKERAAEELAESGEAVVVDLDD